MSDHVDGFYIVDADHTHGGYPKPFTCRSTLESLGLLSEKIKVIELALPSYHQLEDNYFRERHQRNVVSDLFEDDAVYIVSDCDEIIDPRMIPIFVEGAINNPDSIMRVSLSWLCGKANLQVCNEAGTPITFQSPFVCMKHHVKSRTLSDIREDIACQRHEMQSLFLNDQNQKIVESGWHFSWLGGRDRIKFKMKSFLHCYDGQNDIFKTAVGAIPSKEMQDYLSEYTPQPGSLDPYGRSEYILNSYSEDLLPPELFNFPHLYSYFFGSSYEKI